MLPARYDDDECRVKTFIAKKRIKTGWGADEREREN